MVADHQSGRQIFFRSSKPLLRDQVGAHFGDLLREKGFREVASDLPRHLAKRLAHFDSAKVRISFEEDPRGPSALR